MSNMLRAELSAFLMPISGCQSFFSKFSTSLAILAVVIKLTFGDKSRFSHCQQEVGSYRWELFAPSLNCGRYCGCGFFSVRC